MPGMEPILAKLSGDTIAGIVFISCVIICAALGAALGSRFRPHPVIVAIVGFLLGTIVGCLLFMAIIFLTGWWPFSDGP